MSTHLPLTYMAGAGAKIPFQSNAAVADINLFGSATWQVGSVYAATIPVTYVGWTGTQDQKFSISLPFPTFTLPTGAQAFCLASVTLAGPTNGTPLFGMPQLTLATTGSATRTSAAGVSSFAFKAGRAYSGFTLTATVRGYAASAAAQQVVYFNVAAILLGLPPS